MILSTPLSLFSVAFLVAQASAHVYISKVRVDGGDWQGGQKSGASNSYREVSDNTGWIGSQFLKDNKGIVCGASNTPFREVAAPGGKFFSDASQSAQKTLDVNAGSVMTIVTSGNPGEGFPHNNGHVQVWAARCGDGHADCQEFDASDGNWFKIQAEKDGIANTLRKHLSQDLNGQTYDINIPTQLASGSYMIRFELITFHQSSDQEGGQDQYYPMCNQIFVNNGASKMPSLKTVKFPGVYENGNIDPGVLPGLDVMEPAAGGTIPSSSGDDNGNGQPTQPPSNNCTNIPQPPSAAPECASMCMGVKITEAGNLAPDCGAGDVACMCDRKKFHDAFNGCANDHCSGELAAGLAAFDALCQSSAKMMRRAMKRNTEVRRRGHRVSSLLSREP